MVVSARPCNTRYVVLFDVDRLLNGTAEALADQYQTAEPFPHIVLEDFGLADADKVVSSFPNLEWNGWTEVASLSESARQHQPGKRRCRDIERMPPLFQHMIYELSAPRFLGALSELTGIPKLLPDPFLEGGGLQCTAPGGTLMPHTDFHYPPHLKLYRRINALIFLNPDWKPSDGGELSLFNLGKDTPSVTVAPRLGTCVIFTTDHRSVHGVNPIAETANLRRSIALYYYTVEPADVFSGDRATYWYEPFESGAEPGAIYKSRTLAMRGSLRMSKVFARIAYRLNPQHPVQ
jgi:Rps23 Pro-64 3,4-dihydroxylase Tpa1-like proline 4-hydroxylase